MFLDNMKDSIVAKLASQCEDLYGECLKVFQRENLKNIWDKDWIPLVSYIFFFFNYQVGLDKKNFFFFPPLFLFHFCFFFFSFLSSFSSSLSFSSPSFFSPFHLSFSFFSFLYCFPSLSLFFVCLFYFFIIIFCIFATLLVVNKTVFFYICNVLSRLQENKQPFMVLLNFIKV